MNSKRYNKREFYVIDLRFQYSTVLGGFVYAVGSELSLEQLKEQCGQELMRYEPYIYLPMEIFTELREGKRHDDRNNRGMERNVTRAYEENITEMHLSQSEKGKLYTEDPFQFLLEEELRQEKELQLSVIREGLMQLTPTQYRRIMKAYGPEKMSEREIAREEGTDKKSVFESIRYAKKKLLKYFLKNTPQGQ